MAKFDLDTQTHKHTKTNIQYTNCFLCEPDGTLLFPRKTINIFLSFQSMCFKQEKTEQIVTWVRFNETVPWAGTVVEVNICLWPFQFKALALGQGQSLSGNLMLSRRSMLGNVQICTIKTQLQNFPKQFIQDFTI